jgi:hypothetical protein
MRDDGWQRLRASWDLQTTTTQVAGLRGTGAKVHRLHGKIEIELHSMNNETSGWRRWCTLTVTA